MTNYYLLETDNYIDYGVIDNPEIDDDPSFLNGQRITGPIPLLIFEINFPKDEKLPHYLGDQFPLVSKAFLHALQLAGVDNFQQFPARLVNSQTGQSWDDFVAFNVIGFVKAANLDHSDFDVLMAGSDDDKVPPLLAFREIALDKNKIPSASMMFRMAEDPCNVIIHEQVVAVLSTHKPEGGWGVYLTKLT
ncbi:MAG: hypothetical protein V4732_15195 [Pseudomonadota bacterium]